MELCIKLKEQVKILVGDVCCLKKRVASLEDQLTEQYIEKLGDKSPNVTVSQIVKTSNSMHDDATEAVTRSAMTHSAGV